MSLPLSSFYARAWFRATSPAGWATVAPPGGGRATVGGRIKEPLLSPPSPCCLRSTCGSAPPTKPTGGCALQADLPLTQDASHQRQSRSPLPYDLISGLTT